MFPKLGKRKWPLCWTTTPVAVFLVSSCSLKFSVCCGMILLAWLNAVEQETPVFIRFLQFCLSERNPPNDAGPTAYELSAFRFAPLHCLILWRRWFAGRRLGSLSPTLLGDTACDLMGTTRMTSWTAAMAASSESRSPGEDRTTKRSHCCSATLFGSKCLRSTRPRRN